MLTIDLNGDPLTVQTGLTVRGLIDFLGLDPAKVAVERNLEIVPRSSFDGVALHDRDRIEIVHFVGGG